MRLIGYLAVIGTLLLVGVTAAYGSGNPAPGGGDGFVPVLVCHASPTGAGNSGPAQSYELITVDNAGALNGHTQHPNDIIDPEGGVCPTIEPPVDTCETDPTLCPVDPTCETDPTLCPVDPPPDTCEGGLGEQMGVCDPPPPTTIPPAQAEGCKAGFHKWHGKCYRDDGQVQPDGSVIYGEQG